MSAGIADLTNWLGAENHSRYFVHSDGREDNVEFSDPVLEHFYNKGATFSDLLTYTKMSELSLDRKIERLVFQRKVVEIGFTPTDALHALGELHLGGSAKFIAGPTPRRKSATKV
jgi:hypothetical protein